MRQPRQAHQGVVMNARTFLFAFAGLPCLVAVSGCSKGDLPTAPGFLRHEFVEAWGDSGTGDGQFHYPQGVTVDASGNVYVADAGNNRIQKFTSDGTYLTQWGSLGTGEGQFNEYVLGVAVDAGGNVYVADGQNGRIQKFTSDGAYLTQWGTPGRGERQFFWLQGVAVDASGNVYVADGNYSIQKYTSTGAYVTRWAMRDRRYSGAEKVAVDASGNVYATDRYCRCIKMFTGKGRLITQWGLGSWKWLPDVAVDAGGTVYVTDAENNRLLKFARTLAFH